MPFVPQDVLDRLTKLEREVRELRGRAQIRPALNQVLNGDVEIGEGGQLIVRSPSGVEHLRLGDIEEPGRGREFGISIRRADGSVAMSLYNGTGTEEPQVLRLFDSRVNGLLVEDVKAGGLNRPHIPYTIHAGDLDKYPMTTDTNWTVMGRSWAETQHPRVRAFANIAIVSGASGGQHRLLIDGQVVDTQTFPNTIDGIWEVPNYEFGKTVKIQYEARVTGSTTKVWAQLETLAGVGSAG
ncbi:hypothetical protein ACFW5W_07215 [Streptomyces sp. NPDC058783]|uniref:hypothetical protein n=1 Tax=Streptomyces sp. NPDC058783 TaxID=3346633 RepID=UPI0036ABACE6